MKSDDNIVQNTNTLPSHDFKGTLSQKNRIFEKIDHYYRIKKWQIWQIPDPPKTKFTPTKCPKEVPRNAEENLKEKYVFVEVE